MSEAVKIHKQNGKMLEYKGEPVVLVCATEHYGAVMNRPFDFEAYLKDCKAKNQNYTRLFLLFRELQTKENPYSTCKPESPDYISPFQRVGPDQAVDLLPKYDLMVWNNEFFERLHRFMRLARDCDVIVEVVLFSCSYQQPLFELLPLSGKNNVNGTEDVHFNVALSMKAPKLFGHEKRYVQKIVEELNEYPNFLFEICNEPLSFFPQHATVDEINEWQAELIRFIRALEKDMPHQHLIAAEECWKWHEGEELEVGTDHSFRHMDIDIVNVHPLPNMKYGGKTYDLGAFMSKRLHLETYKAFCLDTYHEAKMLNMDEDNIASEFRDYEGWTIHRKRAWTAVFCGAHYDYIDFSIQVMCPTGTPDSQKHVRSWFQYLQNYLACVDLVSCKPSHRVKAAPEETLACALEDQRGFHIYLADKREVDEAGHGGVIKGTLVMDLPDEEYLVSAYAPEFGQFSVETRLLGGREILLPEFRHDLVLRIRKTGAP